MKPRLIFIFVIFVATITLYYLISETDFEVYAHEKWINLPSGDSVIKTVVFGITIHRENIPSPFTSLFTKSSVRSYPDNWNLLYIKFPFRKNLIHGRISNKYNMALKFKTDIGDGTIPQGKIDDIQTQFYEYLNNADDEIFRIWIDSTYQNIIK
jgi:hypothetical protein